MTDSSYCTRERRCRLCQFALVDGETVVVTAFDGRLVFGEFSFRDERTSRYARPVNSIHVCLLRRCRWGDEQALCFHRQCYQSKSHPISGRFLAATEYSLEQSIDHEQKRFRWIQHTLSHNLSRLFPRHLPTELRLMIASHLTRQCAAFTAQEQVKEAPVLEDTIIDPDETIYASYLRIEGYSYIRALHNTFNPGERRPHALFGKYKDLFIAEDHVGIRALEFVSRDQREVWCRNPPSVPNAWWRHISRSNLHTSLLITSDGLKIRQIKSTHGISSRETSHIGWQDPVPMDLRFISLLTAKQPRRYPDGLRMRYFECNDQDVEGYSILCDDAGTGVLDIVTHKRGEEVRKSLHDDCDMEFCMYMPINNGEYLTGIYRQAGAFFIQEDFIGITFSTNQGRTMAFGIHGHSGCDLQRVASLTSRPTRIHFNQANSLINRVELLAMEPSMCDSTNAEDLPALPGSMSPCPCMYGYEPWVYTSCSMQAVAAVHLCVRRCSPHRPIVGMLLRYDDGRHECVGQFRRDWVEETLMIGCMTRLHIRAKRSLENWNYIAAIMTSRPTDLQEEGSWLEVPQSGTLEWWFTPMHTVLSHGRHRLG